MALSFNRHNAVSMPCQRVAQAHTCVLLCRVLFLVFIIFLFLVFFVLLFFVLLFIIFLFLVSFVLCPFPLSFVLLFLVFLVVTLLSFNVESWILFCGWWVVDGSKGSAN